MEDGEEFEMLLGEIPYATSNDSQNYLFSPNNYNNVNGDYAHHSFLTPKRIEDLYDDDPSSHSKYFNESSPVSGFCLQSNGSSSSLFSNGYSVSDSVSPIPPFPEDPKFHMFRRTSHYPNGLWMDSKIPYSSREKKNNESLIDELGLCSNLGKLYISNRQEDSANFRDFFVEREGNRFSDYCSLTENNPINTDKQGGYENFRRTFSDYVGLHSPVSRTVKSFQGEMNPTLLGLQQEHKMSDLLGSRFSIGGHDLLFSELSCCTSPMSSPKRTKEKTGDYYPNPLLGKVTPFSGLSNADDLFYGQQNAMNLTESGVLLKFPSSVQVTHPKPHHLIAENLMYGTHSTNGRIGATSNVGSIQRFPGSFPVEDSFIFQGEALNYMINKGINQSRIQSKGTLCDIGLHNQHNGLKLDGRHQTAGACDNSRNCKLYFPFSVPSKYNSLAEVQGYIYLMAKDQHGCRFLQRILDEGAPRDLQVIFNEIINHVVELMMNSFGNYFMQKLLDICNEEQRMQILFMVTAEPGDLVRISLNTHGTRVVQKLIETLKTRQEISLVISALEPGFLALIKDLNGNHVIQRCLHCFNNEENEFIFSAASKYCVEIATHQHGCCVLQRCISCSTGEYRDNLMAGISANGLLLAQDAYGNYVVQFILDLKVPPATLSLVSQFAGNYVYLSTQKFSSHVVEKCLIVLDDENRSVIIHELLSTSHFEQLLQDPHANYVIQTALRVSEGSLHNSLVEAIESHKAISRNSPYSKKFFSHRLLKK